MTAATNLFRNIKENPTLSASWFLCRQVYLPKWKWKRNLYWISICLPQILSDLRFCKSRRKSPSPCFSAWPYRTVSYANVDFLTGHPCHEAVRLPGEGLRHPPQVQGFPLWARHSPVLRGWASHCIYWIVRSIKNGSSPEKTTSGGCPSPEDVSLATFRGWGAQGTAGEGSG